MDTQAQPVVVVLACAAAFAAYLSMYAFRKPISATGYTGVNGLTLLGTVFDYKAIALVSQLLGYMCSKFLGVKFASEAPLMRRAPNVLGLIAFAWLMLVLFAVTPAPYNLIWLFFNGLPLGMVWSMLFGILEGRRITDFLGLAMSVSVVFASGWVKAVGLWSIDSWGVSPFWMPAVTGALFFPLLLIALLVLASLPPPRDEDVSDRSARLPMDAEARSHFVRVFFPGVAALMSAYVVLISYRALRDDFMDLILSDLGYEIQAADFASIESLVGTVVVATLAGLWFVKSNQSAVWVCAGLVASGSVLAGLSTLLLQNGVLGPREFFIVNGVGLYIAYVPLQTIMIDRLLATLGPVATGAFLIAAADAFGYVSIVGLYLSKNIVSELVGQAFNWTQLLMSASVVVALFVPATILYAVFYFRSKSTLSAQVPRP
ncbi:MAG TPA: hypothetical protein DDW52_28700 [Planctomycetaceae bacterium]|nr:hypothetical protein [Planctomycetaceae bacterium]